MNTLTETQVRLFASSKSWIEGEAVRQLYATAQLDPYAVKPVFAPDNTHADRPVALPAAIRIRDVTIEGVGTVNRGVVATNFYPEGYVDATVVHLEDASGDVMTLEFSPLTGQVAIVNGDVMPTGMSQ